MGPQRREDAKEREGSKKSKVKTKKRGSGFLCQEFLNHRVFDGLRLTEVKEWHRVSHEGGFDKLSLTAQNCARFHSLTIFLKFWNSALRIDCQAELVEASLTYEAFLQPRIHMPVIANREERAGSNPLRYAATLLAPSSIVRAEFIEALSKPSP